MSMSSSPFAHPWLGGIHSWDIYVLIVKDIRVLILVPSTFRGIELTINLAIMCLRYPLVQWDFSLRVGPL